jgi:hypothetical protein
MRWLIIGVALTLLGLPGPAVAQNAAIPPLQRLIDTSYRVALPAHECTVPSTVSGLARQYQFIAGVEYLLVDCQPLYTGTPRDAAVIDLQGLAISDALKKLTEIDPRYRWTAIDGVVVVRPVVAWTDSKNILNFTTRSFVLGDVNVGSALAAVVAALTGQSGPADALHASAQRTEQGAREFSVKMGAASGGDALNAIVRAHGAAWWEVQLGSMQANPLPVVRIHTFDGTGLGLSARSRKPR